MLKFRRNPNPTGSPQTGAPNRGGVGTDWQFSTNISLYLNKSPLPLTNPRDTVPQDHHMLYIEYLRSVW